MEDRQIDEYYKAQRQIYSAMMGDTPVKTVHNRQYIDNIPAYYSEVQRISKSVHHKLDLGPISPSGAQQHTTVTVAAAMKTQDNSMQVQDTENALKAHMQNNNGQYKSEIYKRADSIIPQLDGTYNVSDSSDADLPDYLDLANTNIIPYKTRGQKQRQKAAEALFELQRNVQEQLHKRDKERERNITKRVQEYEKTFDFVNSHLLKGVATMAELTKTDTRQSLGKIKPTDKMVMMPGLFDGTKPKHQNSIITDLTCTSYFKQKVVTSQTQSERLLICLNTH